MISTYHPHGNRETDISQFVCKRRGTILTMFAVFLFALLPLMTLIVHLGMVTLSRRQMQTSVNTAAIDGLRFRDDQSLTETQRRERVRTLVSAVYDDNLGSNAADAMQFGAGSVIAFDDEATDISLPGTDFKAARTIRRENIGVYDPELQLNEANEVHGDMLRGNYVPGNNHSEGNDYTRSDMTPAAAGNAFLVRLRRTDNASSLDALQNVSSAGPAIPFLFGRGPYGGPEFLNRRERGTVVRATAIAQAVPAMTVGPYSPDAGRGVAPLWLELTSWNGLTTGIATNVTLTGSAISGGLIGEFVSSQVTAVGNSLTTGNATSVNGVRYVAIYSNISGTNRVVGFGSAEFQLDASPGTGTVTRLPSQVGSGNVSAAWRGNLAGLSNAEVAELLTNRAVVSEPLLAPALVPSVE